MFEYQAPSDFLDESQNGEDFGEFLNFDTFDANHSPEFPEDKALESQDESTDQQGLGFSGTLGDQGELQDNLLSSAVRPPIDFENSFEGQEQLQGLPDGIPANETSNAGAQESRLPDLDYPPPPQPNAAVDEYLFDEQRAHSRSPTTIISQLEIFINSQQQDGLPSKGHQNLLEPNDLQGQEILSSLNNIDPASGISSSDHQQHDLTYGDDLPQLDHNDFGAHDPFSTAQPREGLTNNEQFLDFNFDAYASKEWQDTIGSRSLEEILGIGVQDEPQRAAEERESREVGAAEHVPVSHGRLGTSSNHTQPPVNSRQLSPFQTLAAGPSTVGNSAVLDDNDTDASDEASEGTNDQVTHDTYQENDPMIVPGIDRKGWGRIGKRNGQEVWLNPQTSKWQPSASHHDMRATLIAKAQAEYPNEKYLHPDPTDGLPHGETAFFKPHQNRGPSRDQCADELFVWREYKPKKGDNGKLLRKGKPKFSIRDHPGYMYEDGKILLDPRNNPVVNHKFIPLTLSAHTDGGKLQEMALQPGCKQIDLWARMPRWEKKPNKNGQSEIISLRDKNTRINMPMTRFREKKGTIAGGDREGTETIMDGLRRFYHHNGFDPAASGNSVKAFHRDLEPWEVKEVRLGNTARFGGRAGNRALDNEKREKNYQKTLKAIENGKNKQAAGEKNGARKRSREDNVDGSPDSNTGPQKRRRTNQEADPGLATWDGGYTGHQGESVNRNGQNVYGLQGSIHPQRGVHPHALGSSREHLNTNGTTGARYQAQPLPIQTPFNPNEITPSFEMFSRPTPNMTQQAPNGGMYTRAASIPYANFQTQTPLNNSLLNSHYSPEDRYSQINAGIQRGPNFGLGEPQQPPRRSSHHQSLGTGRHNMAQQGSIPAFNPGYSFLGGENNGQYGAGDQRQRQFKNANNTPQRPINTVAPGGRRPTQMPEQVLGKRRNRDAPEGTGAEDQRIHLERRRAPVAPSSNYGLRTPATRNGTSQGPPSLQTRQDPDFFAAHKRRRHNPAPENPPPGMGPRPQRHRQPERTPRHDRYGAEGAPTPLMHPDEFFGPLPPSAGQNEDEEWRSKSPNQLYQELQDLFESARTVRTTNGGLNHGMSGAPTWHPENVQHVPGGFEPGQVLGKRGRQEHSSQQGEGMYMPRQHAGQKEAEVQFGGPEQDIQEPGPKRRRMPGTEGQRAPPVPDPRARGVKKIRRVKQDAPLPPPPMNTHQPLSNPPQIPQPDVAVPTQPRYVYINGTAIDVGTPAQVPNSIPPQVPQPNGAVPTQPHYVYINGTPINVGGPAQVPSSLGTHLPPPPHPPHANQQHPVDMRDVRPSSGEQSQSLDKALRYTREAYREWTGQEAPVTNIEDSYNTQYREIRAVFRAWWKSEDNPRRLDPVPELWRMRRWSGTLEDWQAPEGREHLRDAVKRGKQAA